MKKLHHKTAASQYESNNEKVTSAKNINKKKSNVSGQRWSCCLVCTPTLHKRRKQEVNHFYCILVLVNTWQTSEAKDKKMWWNLRSPWHSQWLLQTLMIRKIQKRVKKNFRWFQIILSTTKVLEALGTEMEWRKRDQWWSQLTISRPALRKRRMGEKEHLRSIQILLRTRRSRK